MSWAAASAYMPLLFSISVLSSVARVAKWATLTHTTIQYNKSIYYARMVNWMAESEAACWCPVLLMLLLYCYCYCYCNWQTGLRGVEVPYSVIWWGYQTALWHTRLCYAKSSSQSADLQIKPGSISPVICMPSGLISCTPTTTPFP